MVSIPWGTPPHALRVACSRGPLLQRCPLFSSQHDEIAGGILHHAVGASVVGHRSRERALQISVCSGSPWLGSQVVPKEECVPLIQATVLPDMNVESPRS